MKQTDNKPTADMRHKAEVYVAKLAKSKPRPEDVDTILHELLVHQVQLEMQSEELRRVQADLEASRAQYFDLFDLAPVGYVTVDEKGLILQANLTASALLGLPRGKLAGEQLNSVIHGDDRDIYYLMGCRLRETGAPQACELRMLKTGGTDFWARLEASATPAKTGGPVCRISISDISASKRKDEELRRSEENFRTVADFTYDWEYWVGADGTILYMSPSCERVSGYTREEFLSDNRLLAKIVHPEDAKNFHAHLEANFPPDSPGAGQAGSKYCNGIEFRIIKKDGSVVWIEHACQPVFGRDGASLGRRVSNRDVTAHKREEELLRISEARYHELVDSLEAGVVVHAPDTSVLMSNPRALELLGLSEDQMTGRLAMHPEWKFLHEDHTPLLVEDYPVNRAIAEKKAIKDLCLGIVRPVSKDIAWVSVNATTILDPHGDIHEVIISFVEVTKRKQAEEDLRRQIEIAEKLAVKAEAAARAKSDFIAVMSQELRGPLNVILGFAALLSDRLTDAEQKEFVGRISHGGNDLLAIVEAILDFSRLESGDLELDSAPFVLAETLESACFFIRESAEQKGLEFRCETAPGVPRFVVGDASRVHKILAVLLDNAVKFTAEGAVTLRVAPGVEGGRPFLDFIVEDTGPGIPPETIGLLFKPFTQADSTITRPYKGIGLGLAISRRLAEAMGGSLAVASAVGKGSTFTFRLPLDVSATLPAGVPADAAQPAAPAPAPVLVVENDAANSLLARKLLAALGYQAEFAANGREALEAFVPGKFVAILMDVMMPVMDGLEAARKIREVEASAGVRVPIIAATAAVMPGDREKCLDAGMDEFLAKPFTKEAFAAVLAGVTKGARG